MMAGRDVAEIFPRSPRTAGEVVLEVTGLAGVLKPLAAGFELRAGEMLGIGGLVGAGRTELLRAIFGLDPVVRGTVRVRAPGVAGLALAAPRRGRRPAQRGPQGRGPRARALGRRQPHAVEADRAGPAGVRAAAADRRPWPGAWMARLGIRAASASQPVRHLSGGNQQKVALARLLYHDVDVLLLDEPTRGIDVASKAQIYELIDALAKSGKAVLLVSSYLPELLGVCDRIAVMARGRLGPPRPVADLTEHGLLMEAMGQA